MVGVVCRAHTHTHTQTLCLARSLSLARSLRAGKGGKPEHLRTVVRGTPGPHNRVHMPARLRVYACLSGACTRTDIHTFPPPPRSLSLARARSLSLSLSHTHTHSLSHTHTLQRQVIKRPMGLSPLLQHQDSLLNVVRMANEALEARIDNAPNKSAALEAVNIEVPVFDLFIFCLLALCYNSVRELVL